MKDNGVQRSDDLEETLLRDAFRLDDGDLAFLQWAGLPAQLTARVALAQQTAPAAGQVASLWWLLAGCAAAYAGWLLALPPVWEWFELARRAGATTYLASQAATLALRAVDGFARIVEATSYVPGFGAPLVSLSLLAVLAWITLAVLPLLTRAPGARQAA